MSYYNKQQFLIPDNDEKKVMQALMAAELKNHSADTEACLKGLKEGLTTGKKHSSATLLRKKLKGHLIREFHEI